MQVPNKIEELCRNIRLEIDSRVQDVLDNLTKDSQALTKIVDQKVGRLHWRQPRVLAARAPRGMRMDREGGTGEGSKRRGKWRRGRGREKARCVLGRMVMILLCAVVDPQVERNKNCKSHNTFAMVWKVLLGVVFVVISSELAVWGLLNHAESDVLGLCESQVSSFGGACCCSC